MPSARTQDRRNVCRMFWDSFWENEAEEEQLWVRSHSRTFKLMAPFGVAVSVGLLTAALVLTPQLPSSTMEPYIVLLVIGAAAQCAGFAALHFRLEPVCVLYFVTDSVIVLTQVAIIGVYLAANYSNAAALNRNTLLLVYAAWHAFRLAQILLMIIAFAVQRRERIKREEKEEREKAELEAREEEIKLKALEERRAARAAAAATANDADAGPTTPLVAR